MDMLGADASKFVGAEVRIKIDVHLGIQNENNKPKVLEYSPILGEIIKIVEKNKVNPLGGEGPKGILAQ